jgi:hypothetical protein
MNAFHFHFILVQWLSQSLFWFPVMASSNTICSVSISLISKHAYHLSHAQSPDLQASGLKSHRGRETFPSSVRSSARSEHLSRSPSPTRPTHPLPPRKNADSTKLARHLLYTHLASPIKQPLKANPNRQHLLSENHNILRPSNPPLRKVHHHRDPHALHRIRMLDLQDRVRILVRHDQINHLEQDRVPSLQDLAHGLQRSKHARHLLALAVPVVALGVVGAFDAQHSKAGGKGPHEVVEGLAAQSGTIDGVGGVSADGVGVACEEEVVAVGAPGVLFGEDEVVEFGDEEEGFRGGEGGDAVEDLGGGGNPCGFCFVVVLFFSLVLVFGF